MFPNRWVIVVPANHWRAHRRDGYAGGITAKTWFITGASRGFGREWAIVALERGDFVAATGRDTSTLDDLVDKYRERLLPVKLDVTDREADFAA
jgi:NADP-dependent 3-hydroxy acid dehydrogenase YdfG